MRGCAENPAIFIENRPQKLNFSIFLSFHEKNKNLKLRIIFLSIFNFETSSEQHFSWRIWLHARELTCGWPFKRSVNSQNSTSPNFPPNYSLSFLQGRSSTSQYIIKINWCMISNARVRRKSCNFHSKSSSETYFLDFLSFHGKIKNLKLRTIFLLIFRFNTNSEQHFSCTNGLVHEKSCPGHWFLMEFNEFH